MGLLEILKRPESKTLEFKRDLSSPDGALKTIVAFANTAGGTLLVGVEDRSRHVRGVPDPLDLEERLANLVSDRVSPRIVPEIEILPWRRTQVLALQVHPSPSRPHHLTREGPAGGVYVRVGSTHRRADAELIEELRRFARGEGFDEQPMPGLDSEALDFRAASESFATFRKLARRDLQTLRLLTDHQGRKVPTVGGMILFGKDRECHFPDAWIQAGRFQGTDKSRIVDRAEIRSLPVRATEEAIAFVHKHALHGAEIGAVRRKERWNLPPEAVREAIINAVAHTDYAQRGAANILRGKTAGQDSKNYILSLMFYKRLCDQWECEADDAIAELERQQGRAFSGKEKAVLRKHGEHRFRIPNGSRWGDVKAASTNLGEVLTKAMRAVANAKDELRGVFTVDWNQPAPDGSGGMLVHAADFLREQGQHATSARYFAQEMNWGNAAIGKINSVLHRMKGLLANQGLPLDLKRDVPAQLAPLRRWDGSPLPEVSKAGNRHVRAMAIGIAWGWLRFQPRSALSQWYQHRFGRGSKRLRKIGIVALARKLLIELWRYLETGVVPEGAELKTDVRVR